ncbi:double-stranded RNA-binding protein Staufen homolog 2 isoform X1 [Drosophila teissieri]|uniref:double-stranded RNA-binding protein Staufen homolog 2 isoform X1 n=2 Tax=Drosophila teissieri TaxID=7243 RepID=UPI001CB9FA39|nr:double-stranded RNA-binding protein Staufen homolog 2 isoform X1 [Drosophila teissieri]XP_043640985.1 double-stranded RNA-binding protein Staufen homolog 2 isoform X1 [Drosophila teissieri]
MSFSTEPIDNKSAVSALQEFCAKTKNIPPSYEYIDGEDGGYVCKVDLMEVEAYGNGRSKRDAKHLAAVNILRKIRKLPGVDQILQDWETNKVGDPGEELINLNRDMLKELRDYCVRHEMPLPTIEIVQQSGTPNAPEFVACCSVASIVRYGKSDKKKDARQRAAIEMLALISSEADNLRPDQMQVASTKKSEGLAVEETLEELEVLRRKKFNTYRELTEAGSVDHTGLRLCDRHNYFKNFYPALKEAALEAINSDEFMTSKDKALSVMSALKITPSISTLESSSMVPLLCVELNCDFDVVFAALETNIYDQIIDYFRTMLI